MVSGLTFRSLTEILIKETIAENFPNLDED